MTTSLPRSPPVCYFLDGMDLGQGIDAITGEITKSALDSTFTKEDVNSSEASETFSFRSTSDVSDLESSQGLGFSGSVTFPADAVNVGVKRTFDFSNSTKSSMSVLLIILSWEKRGTAKRVSSDAKLSGDAKTDISNGTFRSKYGDFFVYQVSSFVKFTASFEQEISGSLTAGEVKAEDSVVGNAGATEYDTGNVVSTFNNFRKVATPVSYQALLRHYSTIDAAVSRTIAMDPDVYERVCKVFTLARFVLFLIGIVPGTRTVRMKHRQDISKIFSTIHAKRLEYETNRDILKSSLNDLNALYDALWLRLQRQDLVVEMHSITYEEMKRKFAVEHENVRGAWIQSYDKSKYFVLGRIGFSESEVKKYAVLFKRDVAEVNVSWEALKQQVGSLEFPGTTGINGYVVGLTVQSVWEDGTDGWWCIGKELSLGTKQAKVEVKTEGSRGMHWKLHVHYIPASEYDE
ncbi:hypothetical protein B0H16DRAFT_1689906 [Mycena metata]|uniref:Uncharacterized protein n=1 Tax=Mycena metata TaxID=1033252 RepID=A0AAD7J359_9AGAR|nr:hypothetical protein B0H16DRAFT_1689906 [Mycena metata]